MQDGQSRQLSAQVAQLQAATSAIQSQLGVITSVLDNMVLQIENVSRDNRCCICLIASHDAQLLPCMHNKFCKTCLEQHLEINNHCPVCRTEVRGMLTTFG